MTTLKKKYREEIRAALKEELGFDNIMQVPRITKITLNMGVGEAVGDKKVLDNAVADMTKIAGQKPIITKARRSIAGFKIRDGWPIGCKVTLRSAPAGTGIIAGGPMRAVFESLGVADVVTKSVGTSNPYNMIRATFAALSEQTSPKSVAQRRGKKIADLLGRGGSKTAEADAEAIAE